MCADLSKTTYVCLYDLTVTNINPRIVFLVITATFVVF